MNRRLAKWLWAGIPVAWETDDGPQEAVTATAAPAVHIHYHLHLAPGQDPDEAIEAAEEMRSHLRNPRVEITRAATDSDG